MGMKYPLVPSSGKSNSITSSSSMESEVTRILFRKLIRMDEALSIALFDEWPMPFY